VLILIKWIRNPIWPIWPALSLRLISRQIFIFSRTAAGIYSNLGINVPYIMGSRTSVVTF